MSLPFLVDQFISNQSMTASFNSAEKAIEFYRRGFSIQLVWTGTPAGDFKLQASNDGNTWDDISGTTVAAGGAAGDTIYNVSDAMYRLVRVVYTQSGSTGTVNGFFY